ncbi:uncharacterized protein LOC113312322 [Papaver somniferum]|uniref:uncharacterized protein LOC113312322 n=1 Tax=Papaver somniferum TaxID=3469 RepID=UPI000E700AB3|nr:uncharacterized protein LOC113312322 [Papaver somniferum]
MTGGVDKVNTIKEAASQLQAQSDRLVTLEEAVKTISSAVRSLATDIIPVKESLTTIVLLCQRLGIPTTPIQPENPEQTAIPAAQELIHQSGKYSRHPKIDFPRFDGSNPRCWIRKCNRYFQLNSIDEFHKVDLASIHFDGKANSWFLDYQEGKPFIDWPQFSSDVCCQFEDVAYDNYVGSFNKLAQITTVEEYYERYESLKALMKSRNPSLSEDYYTMSFVSGLKEEIRNVVQMFKPASDTDAFYLARMQQASVDFQYKNHKPFSRPFQPSTTNYLPSTSKPTLLPLTTPPKTSFSNTKPIIILPHTPTKLEPNTPPIRRLTPAQMKGHMCKTQQLFMLVASDDVASPSSEDTEDEVASPPSPAISTMEISLHALTGLVTQNTIRVPGQLYSHDIFILIDTGNTHSFVDAKLADQLQLPVEPTGQMLVTVANGDSTISRGICNHLQWSMQDYQFQGDLRVLPLGGCDMFLKNNAPTIIGQLFSISTAPLEPIHPDISTLLDSYVDVFEPPTSLPPQRAIDHQIPLKPNAAHISQKPYKCPHLQKSVVEKLIQEMLDVGFIQDIHSPFASPILLVKKKDGSWRFCVDYRKLNDITIKDKLSIPLIGDLLDELHGAVIFTKIDLKSGYYQILMHIADIHKTAFRTHQGHYVFRVMLFGLTNAPATFQSLMNTIFKPFLRKLVLVFFDDILIYSKSLEDHAVHLSQVLSLLRQHSLFANKNKCCFAQTKLAYLGYLITSEGVAADPDKIAAMPQ